MDNDEADEYRARAHEFVGRLPPSDGESIWVDDAYVFDLLVAICDLLHDDGCRRSSFYVERALDEFLYETDKAPPPKWRMRKSNREQRRPTQTTTTLPERIQERPQNLTRQYVAQRPVAARASRDDNELEQLISNVCSEDGTNTELERPVRHEFHVSNVHGRGLLDGNFGLGTTGYEVTIGPFQPRTGSPNPKLLVITEELTKRIAKKKQQ